MHGAKLGQHFLIHSWAARSLAHAAAPEPGETILEIGPGKGILTKELLTIGNVTAVEKDPELVARLRSDFADAIALGRLTLIEGDVRDFEPATLGSYVVAANIPYYITGEIIRHFLSSERQPRAMALLVQKEVAQRAVSDKESLLSLSIKAYGTPKIVEKVPKKHFSPPPRVDSAILLISNISRAFFSDFSENDFFRVLHAAFSSKRKFAINNIANEFEKGIVAEAFKSASVSEKARAEDVSLGEWRVIVRELLGHEFSRRERHK